MIDPTAIAIRRAPTSAHDLTADVLEPLGTLPPLHLGQRGAGGGHQLASFTVSPPSMPRPTSSAGASGGYSPVMRPS